ncbi:hypothetical protein L2E82_40853 [Cichorium intybus]|uniref:Uncharacterized protein n=1 Tax=Cichorium intybus TaxID=13427 RepID=A0ACB9ALY1_CICIN|nr:hypothetical protein L2E82_40853 [Cichorium intybus]
MEIVWKVDRKPDARRNLVEEAKKLDILVKDKNRELIQLLMWECEDPIFAHNRYPELWAQINTEEWKSTLVGKEKEDPSKSLVFFMRAVFRNSPKWAMLFWEGDQMVSWQVNDGIKSGVVGLLSSGLCGYAFNHSDIGGYCAINLPFFKYRRDEEIPHMNDPKIYSSDKGNPGNSLFWTLESQT